MAVNDFRYNRFGIFTDLMYTKIAADASGPADLLQASVTNQITTAALMGEYGVVDQGNSSMDVMAGGRTISDLLAFLDLSWDHAGLEYRETALKRGRIATPSNHRVTESLHTRATGRWQNYQEEMSSIRPVLQPGISAWGYAGRARADD